MPSYTFEGLEPGRSAEVRRHGGGGGDTDAVVTTGTVGSDGTLTVSLPAAGYVADDGRRRAFVAPNDGGDDQGARLVIEGGAAYIVTGD